MPRRRIILGVVSVAALLVAGRSLSALYVDYTWYRVMGAGPLWRERLADSILLYGAGFGAAFAIALANFSALARSIGSLTLPRRLANVEFGEAVPKRYLDRFALGLSIGVAMAVMPMLPRWTDLALIKLGVSFGERDPYFHHDLGFYTTWLPFEKGLYGWLMVLIALITLLVVVLYSLTPGLRWERGGLRMSIRVRHHLTVLATVILLLTMWSYRLASYELLIQAPGEQSVFSYIEHQWLLPGLLLLSIATIAVAATVLYSGWTGQLRIGFVAVTAVLLLSVSVQQIVPLVVRQVTDREATAANERPYRAIRADFTRRAYDLPSVSASARGSDSAISGTREEATRDSARLMGLSRDSLVYPGAGGLVVVADPQLDAAGQPLGQGLSRLAYAWAYQSIGLLADSVPRRARLVAVRDVRNRVRALAPAFALGSRADPLFHADTLYWRIHLYSASSDFPLSENRSFAGVNRNYFRRAATALVNGRTGRVMVAPVASPDPLAREWMRAFPAFADRRAAAVAQRLTPTPWNPDAGEALSDGNDSTFRGQVTRVHNLMRAALAAGNLKDFASAYDSLGALLRRTAR